MSSQLRVPVSQALPAKPVAEDQVHRFTNDELIKVLTQLRTASNLRGLEHKTVNTAGAGAFATVWTSPVFPTNAVWGIRAEVAGVNLTGFAAQQARYVFAGTFASVAGTVSQVGATTTVVSHESAAAIDFRFTVDAVNRVVTVDVRDDAVSQMRFTAIVETTEGLQA